MKQPRHSLAEQSANSSQGVRYHGNKHVGLSSWLVTRTDRLPAPDVHVCVCKHIYGLSSWLYTFIRHTAEAAGESPHALELNIRNLTNALKDVSNWEMLGIQLGVELAQIRQISSKNPKIDLLDLWLKNDPEHSWEKVAGALDEMGMRNVAREIRTACCSSG